MPLDVARATKAYLNLRDARSALKKEFDAADKALKDKQELLQAHMLKFLNEHKMDTASNESGVFYKQEEIIPTGGDWDAFYKWVAEHDAFDFLMKRITAKAVSDYMDANDGAVPPGVNVFRRYTVRVRRSAKE